MAHLLLWLSLALLACRPGLTPSDVAKGDSDSPVDSSTEGDDSPAEGDDSAGGDDSPVDSPVEGQRCPPEMAPVTDADGVVRFCIDRWEAVVEGDLGSPNQYEEGAEITTATARSVAGELPNTGVTFDQARRVCANTSVLDADGVKVGNKRLVRSEEWEDAGDGVWGEGGTLYPYGDTWIEGICNVPDTSGQPTQESELVAGSMPECVSAFGVYDLIGNLWEWTDPLWNADSSAFFTAAASQGAVLGDDDTVSWGEDISGITMDVPGVSRSSLERGEDGTLRAWADPATRPYIDRSALGYLVLHVDGEYTPEDFLPILILPDGDPLVAGPAHVYLARDLDGKPLTNKQGCAWYTGGSCTMSSSFYGHTHDFEGSIGVRCSADPY